jgi:hypothetical protein
MSSRKGQKVQTAAVTPAKVKITPEVVKVTQPVSAPVPVEQQQEQEVRVLQVCYQLIALLIHYGQLVIKTDWQYSKITSCIMIFSLPNSGSIRDPYRIEICYSRANLFVSLLDSFVCCGAL